jgi:hypothetical protein
MDLMTQIFKSSRRSVKIQFSAAAFVQTLMSESDFHGVFLFRALTPQLSENSKGGLKNICEFASYASSESVPLASTHAGSAYTRGSRAICGRIAEDRGCSTSVGRPTALTA